MKTNKSKSDIGFILANAGRHKYKIIFSVFCAVIQSLLVLVPFALIYEILVAIKEETADLSTIRFLVILTCLAAVGVIAFNFMSLAFSHMAAFSILSELRLATVEHIGKLEMGFFRTRTSGELKKALDEDVEKLENFVAHHIPDVIDSVITPVAIITYLFFVNKLMALLMLIPVALLFFLQYLVMRGYSARLENYTKILAKLHGTIVQYIHGMNIFKAFNLTARNFKDYVGTSQEYYEMWKDVTRSSMLNFSIFLVAVDSGLLFTIPVGGILFLSGSLSFSEFVIFLLLSSAFLQSFMKILFMGSSMAMLTKGAETARKIMESPEMSQGNAVLENPEGNITIENLSFEYTNKEVLSSINLNFPPRTTTALVGPSGSGKTTLGMLIGRMWDVEKGRIIIDGKDIKELTMESLMINTAFVFQRVFMLNDTVFNNINMGLNKNRDQVIAAAKQAQIHDFIMTMPNGYDTVVGEESGIKMSGGEMQRISIARAVLKNPPILILDEVTAYSDIENETKIQEAIKALTKNKTVIIIAHRLYTVMDADNIVVIDEGRVREQGTHQQLMDNKDMYYDLWKVTMDGDEYDK